jgi:hypothetical protein
VIRRVRADAPERWKGQFPDYAWGGPEILDFHESCSWFYGSLCVRYPDPSVSGLPGISLNYNTQVFGPVRFSPPFTDLPLVNFTIRELIDMLDRHGVRFEDVRPDRTEGLVLISEGGVAAASLGENCSPKAQIVYLFPHDFKGA